MSIKKEVLTPYLVKKAGSTQTVNRVNEDITKQVLDALDNALNKKKLCDMLEISFPTLERRFYRDNWTPSDRAILREKGIIRNNYRVESSDEIPEDNREGVGTMYPVGNEPEHTTGKRKSEV